MTHSSFLILLISLCLSTFSFAQTDSEDTLLFDAGDATTSGGDSANLNCAITLMTSSNFIVAVETMNAGSPAIERATVRSGFNDKIDRYNYGGTRCNCGLSFFENENFGGKVLNKPIFYDFIRDGAYGGFIPLANHTAYSNNPDNCTQATWNTLVSSYKIVCYDFSNDLLDIPSG